MGAQTAAGKTGPQQKLNEYRENQLKKASALQRRLDNIRAEWKKRTKQAPQTNKTHNTGKDEKISGLQTKLNEIRSANNRKHPPHNNDESDEDVTLIGAQEQTPEDEYEVSSDDSDTASNKAPGSDITATNTKAKGSTTTSTDLGTPPDEANNTQKLSDGDYDTTPNLMTPDSEDYTSSKRDQSKATAEIKMDASTSDIDITSLYFDKNEDTEASNNNNDVDITQLYFDKAKRSKTDNKKRRNKSRTKRKKKKQRMTKEKQEKTRPHQISTKSGIRRRARPTGTANGEAKNENIMEEHVQETKENHNQKVTNTGRRRRCVHTRGCKERRICGKIQRGGHR